MGHFSRILGLNAYIGKEKVLINDQSFHLKK